MAMRDVRSWEVLSEGSAYGEVLVDDVGEGHGGQDGD